MLKNVTGYPLLQAYSQGFLTGSPAEGDTLAPFFCFSNAEI
jgi:hypothetical protein